MTEDINKSVLWEPIKESPEPLILSSRKERALLLYIFKRWLTDKGLSTITTTTSIIANSRATDAVCIEWMCGTVNCTDNGLVVFWPVVVKSSLTTNKTIGTVLLSLMGFGPSRKRM